MSTKIWKAYRVPIGKLNEFFSLVEGPTLTGFYERLDYLMKSEGLLKLAKERRKLEEEVLAERDGALPAWWHSDPMYLEERWQILQGEMKKASLSIEHHFADVDASFNVWLYGKYAYLIPYGKVCYPNPMPEWVEDYHYQDQTDRPEDISPQAWRARREMWDKVCLDDWDATRMVHHIINFSPLAYKSAYLAEIHLGLIRLR